MDATHNALVAVTNGGNRATEALLTLHFDDGGKNYEIEQTIQPGEQMWLNFADLIHHGVPDRKGNALPADVTSGTYDLEDLNPGLGGNLIEGKVALDKTFGHLTYGCLTCCGYTPYLSPGTVTVTVGGGGGISTFGTNNCTGQGGYSLNTYYNQTGRWLSDNISTATVTAYHAQGVAAGRTMARATATIPNGDGGVPKPPCRSLDQEADAPVPVQVPTSLRVISSQVISNTWIPECLATYFGIVIQINYQVLDQNGANLASANMEPQEEILDEVFDGTPFGNPEPTWVDVWKPNYPGSAQFTSASGQFLDAPFGACTTSPFVDTFTQPISMLLNGTNYTVRTNNWKFSSVAAGHGSVTNGSDISQSK